MEVTPGFEPGNQGFADPCLTTWLCHHMGTGALLLLLFGAGDEARTRYLHLGKVALYQMSYARMKRAANTARWCLRSESNQRHEDFQSSALPTELQRHMATEKGLEPSTSSVTGWRSNQLNYSAICVTVLEKSGGNNRARTCDPLLVRHVLSQLSYAPVRFLCETACVIIRGENGNVKA